MHYILMVFLGAGLTNFPYSAVAEFNSKQACETAAAIAKQKLNSSRGETVFVWPQKEQNNDPVRT